MPGDIITLDTEASGLSDDSYPISIGIAGDNKTWFWLICPLEDWDYWDEFSAEIHGISRSQLIEQGRDPYLVCRELNALFADKVLIVDSTWDVFWISKMFRDINVKMNFQIRKIEDIYSPTAASAIFEEIEKAEWRHSASQDAAQLREILIRH